MELTAGEAVAAAVAETAEATSYRLTQSTAQTISSTALGIDQEDVIDPDRPNITAEITPEASHFLMHVGGLLGSFAEGLGEVELEMWVDSERVVIDTTDYAQVAEANPGAALGPLEPGVAFVDLVVLNADAPELVRALTGSASPDLAVMSERLPDALTDLQRDATNPNLYRGSASYADFLAALGNDVEIIARSTAAGLALNLSIDVEALAEVYLDFYRSTSTAVTVEVDDDGLLSVLTTSADLSGIYESIFRPESGLDLGLPPEQIDQARAAFADTVLILETRVAFEPDPDLVVEAGPATDDDRTAEWGAFLTSAGIGG